MSYKILYFCGPDDFSDAYRFRLNTIMRACGLNIGDLFIVNLHKEIGELTNVYQRGSQFVHKFNKPKLGILKQAVDAYIARIRPHYIVSGEPATCYLFTHDNDSVAQCRGGVYRYGEIGVSIVDNIRRIHDTPHGNWVAIHDWRKVSRFVSSQPTAEPKFEYRVCRTLDDLGACREFFRHSPFKTIDIETRDNWISSIGYCGWADGKIISWIIPFWNPLKRGACHWDTEGEEIYAWETVREINASEAIAIMQNGHYDCGYLIRYHCPVTNYFVDTKHMWHCVYSELPKRLDFITSIVVDHYIFWKEESKGEENEHGHFDGARQLERYWRYNALDTFYTTISAWKFIPLILQTPWALRNYTGQFARQVGPCLAMEMRGFLIDDAERRDLILRWQSKLNASDKRIKVMCDSDEFSFGSPKQVSRLFYDVLGAKSVKVKGKERGTGEVVLKIIGDQHRIFKIYADVILECREAKKLLEGIGVRTGEEKYATPFTRKKRFHYSQNADGTYTSRLSSGTWQWEGGNGQNISHEVRSMFVADEGWILFDIDLEQSDARYVAYESEDELFIKNVESGKDTHCLHAAHFFKEPYEFIMEQIKNGVPRYAHKVTGIRAITKKIVHGANYHMAAYTLYQTIVKDLGKDAIINAAFALGHKNARSYSMEQLVRVCQDLLESYHDYYLGLRPWFDRLKKALKDGGKKLTTSFGWTSQFFGDIEDAETMRKATAFMGQGDTGGCINRAMDIIYYGEGDGKPSLEDRGLRLLLQVHDSLVGMVRHKDVHLLAEVGRIFELPVRIHGREMKVPASIAISERHWGDKNLKKVPAQWLENGDWKKLFQKEKV